MGSQTPLQVADTPSSFDKEGPGPGAWSLDLGDQKDEQWQQIPCELYVSPQERLLLTKGRLLAPGCAAQLVGPTKSVI